MHADDDALKFENVIWTCSTMFNSDTRTKRGCRRRVYMMTNDTDPSRELRGKNTKPRGARTSLSLL